MVYFFIDECGEGIHTKGFAALCVVVIRNPDAVCSEIKVLREDILHNLRLKEILGRLSTEGFHYTSDHREIKNVFIQFLKTLTFHAYICFEPDASENDFKNTTYDRLLEKIIIDRLRNHRDEEIIICFEQHDKPQKRQMEIEKLVNLKIEEINISERPFRGTCNVTYGTKKDDSLAIADYICGIFKAYFEKGMGKEQEPIEKRDFDDLRMKIRCIHNIATNEFYDRRKPFP